MTKLSEFRQNIFVDPDICQIVQLHLFCLGGEAAQGLEGMSADEVGKNAAQCRYHRRDIPVCCAKASLCSINKDRQLAIGRCHLRVKAYGVLLVEEDPVATLQCVGDGIHIIDAGGAEQQIHGDTGNADEQSSHQCDAPLQRNFFQSVSPPIR